LIGTMSLLVLGLLWNGLATNGAGPIGPLPPSCDAHVNDGLWIPIDGCNESSRGAAYRDSGVASYGTCAPHGHGHVWGWKETQSSSRCRFVPRNKARLKSALNRRRVVFIGDSMTRNLYHAALRGMGVEGSGAYDATLPKHADILNTLWGTTPVTFKCRHWRPTSSLF